MFKSVHILVLSLKKYLWSTLLITYLAFWWVWQIPVSPDSRCKSNSACCLWAGQSETGLLAPSVSASNWSGTGAEEVRSPALRRRGEPVSVVPPGPSPQPGLQTTRGLVGCAVAGITTGTDITELVIHHVWHRGYFRKYCFGTFRNNYIKVGAAHCFRGRSGRQ